MITEKDLEALELSPTKKDFYQIWNELLETAKKISARWDPTSTNESDPGIVLLKVLTGIADKLNYNIDKNILEAFMPSATQQDSMRKLCELAGYNIKYYQSAEIKVRVGWAGYTNNGTFTIEKNESAGIKSIFIPQFSVIKNNDEDIVYTTTEGGTIQSNIPVIEINCIEGQVIQCSPDTDYVISLDNLDDNFRYYLPEAQIAENGFFVYNINNGAYQKNEWSKVDNLNTQPTKAKVYKFGFDSHLGLPYLQFPEDVGNIIEDGLYIYYTRTLGVNGNIAARTLSKIELADGADEYNTDANNYTDSTNDVSAYYELLSISNENAAMNGANIETITQAYNNFKKTVGTFDTLVTCRDYMNKIYQLYDDLNVPLVSNVIVSDIRDDLNRAFTLCTFDQYGIKYTDTKMIDSTTNKERITNFDIILYPFKTIYGLNNEQEFIDSFKFSAANSILIESELDSLKTISHNIIIPNGTSTDILCIKNYFKINAKITTTTKVNAIEEAYILDNIYKNIYKTFNARQLDFGETIPFDSILECIETADTRIKNVSMEEPIIITKVALIDGTEIDISDITSQDSGSSGAGIYAGLVTKNILAGRAPLFDYDETFKPELSESTYTGLGQYNKITKIEPICDYNPQAGSLTANGILKKNEIIQFRAPSLKTTLTYPAYVNYFAKLNTGTAEDAHPATMKTVLNFMDETVSGTNNWDDLLTHTSDDVYTNLIAKKVPITFTTSDAFTANLANYGCIFKLNDSNVLVKATVADWHDASSQFYVFPITSDTFVGWTIYIKTTGIMESGALKARTGLYTSLGVNLNNPAGKLVDSGHKKYRICNIPDSFTQESSLKYYFVQDMSGPNPSANDYGIGIDATVRGIPKNCEYTLGEGEYILINYTKAGSSQEDGSTSADTIINEVLSSSDGTIIKTNFDLYDSSVYNSSLSHSFSKTTGFGPWNGYSTPAGMFTLGPNEQIEVRKPVAITLDSGNNSSKNINIYWLLNNKTQNESFPISNDGYTLQENEYFFYTDENKLEMSYFGSGTKIKIQGLIPTKNINTSDVSADDIIEKGILAIPWVQVSVNNTGTRKIDIIEYQYITLAEGDALSSISLIDNNTDDPITTIGDHWYGCSAATYIIDGESGELPAFNSDSLSWEVHSKLLLNVGPALTQTLADSRDSIKIRYTPDGQTTPTTKTIAYEAGDDAISFKTNYLCQSGNDIILINNDIDDFKLKAFKSNTLETTYIKADTEESVTEALTTNNFGNYWTKLSFEKCAINNDSTTQLYCNINSSDQFGMLMIYLVKKEIDYANDDWPYLTIDNGSLAIYNYPNSSSETWWTNAAAIYSASITEDSPLDWANKTYYTRSESANNMPTASSYVDIYGYKYTEAAEVDYDSSTVYYELSTVTTTPYYLRAGINCIKIPATCTSITIHKNIGNNTNHNVIIFGQLDVINKTQNTSGVNAALLGLSTTDITKLLTNLVNYDKYNDNPDGTGADYRTSVGHSFYYNCPIENGSAIDLNTTKKDGKYINTLRDANIWYDYNNINNKFVISEIDAPYLKDGIQLTRTSKL